MAHQTLQGTYAVATGTGSVELGFKRGKISYIVVTPPSDVDHYVEVVVGKGTTVIDNIKGTSGRDGGVARAQYTGEGLLVDDTLTINSTSGTDGTYKYFVAII
jgi:hypothetical protein